MSETSDPSVHGNQADRRERAAAWLFVAIQGVILVAIVFGPRDKGWTPSPFVVAFGTSLVAAGVGLGIWAAIHLGRGLTPLPIPNGAITLVSTGPYRWIRHPMYTAVMVLVVGVAVRAGSLIVVGEAIALIVLFNVKARWEEERLQETFSGYVGYMASTPRFLPGLPTYRETGP